MTLHIRCGRLFDGLDAEVRQDQVIVVDDGLLSYVGPAASAPAVADGDEVVDHSNEFVMPGLVDYHTHLAYGNAKCEEDIDIYAPVEFRALRGMFMAQRVLRAGYTSICNPGDAGRIGPSIRDAIRTNMFVGPRITTAGPYVTSRQGLTDWYPTWIGQPETSIGHVVRSPDEAIEEIRCQVKDGVDVIKLAMDGDLSLQPTGVSQAGGLIAAFNQQETTRMTEEAHRLGKRVIAHGRGKESTLYSARAGVDVIFHASWLDDECLDAILESGSAICPTLTLLVNNYEFSQPTDNARTGWAEACKAEAETAFEGLAKAYKAGVPMLTGTDSGFAITPYGEWHAKEIKIFVDYLGISPAEALRCATSVSGSYLSDGDRVGALEPGRHADIVAFDGDPLADIGQLLDHDRFKAIYLGGELVDVETREVDQGQITDFSYNMWSDLYTQERVSRMGNAVRSIAAE
jgi:imidazolonepropionase-like amidohydrolase